MATMASSSQSKLSSSWADQELVDGFDLLPVNMLACPKDVKLVCEMSGRPANVQMVTPYITLYFATRDDAEQAWSGIMHKIIPLLGPIRTVPPVIGSEEERSRRQYTLEVSKRALIDLCKNESANLLAKRQYALSIPGALMSMKLIKDVHGDGNIEIVSSYLLLSEANLGLKRYQSAEEFLSLANWSVLQNPSCSNAVRSQLHRNFGKLYAAQGKHREALDQLSQDVYYSSLLVGPEHVDTACGYFYMAYIFYTQSRIESALALYDKVVDVWYKFLASVLNNTSDMDSLGEAQIAEAQEMLRKILSTREKFLGDSHIATGEAKYTLGLLHLFIGETPPAMDNITSAAAIYNEHLGPQHPSTRDVEAVLKQLEESGPNMMRASQQTR